MSDDPQPGPERDPLRMGWKRPDEPAPARFIERDPDRDKVGHYWVLVIIALMIPITLFILGFVMYLLAAAIPYVTGAAKALWAVV